MPPEAKPPVDLAVAERAARRLEWWVVGLCCLAAFGLQGVLHLEAGAFWRDEASTLLVASAPDLATMWDWLAKDSSPALVYTLLRLWRFAGPDDSQSWLRLFGTLVWVGLVASLVATCRAFTGRAALLAAPLVALNPSVFYWGSSLRSYGLAVLLIMPCCAAFWRLTENPTRGNVAAAAALAILSCHASYQNSYLLFAMGLAAAACCAAARRWKRALLVLSVGLAAALSLLVYAGTVFAYRDVARIASFDIPLTTIGERLTDAVAHGNTVLGLCWAALFAGAVGWLAVRVVRRLRGGADTPAVELYFLVILVVAGGAGLVFFKMHGLFPNPWHFMPFLAIAAILIEVSLAPGCGAGPAARARIVVALLILAVAVLPLWRLAHVRRTNLDRLTLLLRERAAPQDLILVKPFWIAPGFKYHYNGAAEWNTLPLTSTDLATSIFPFAPIKRVMTEPAAMQSTLRHIELTFERGNRLWIVGFGIVLPKPEDAPLNLPPAPTSMYGWNSIVYQMDWDYQLGAFLRDRGCRLEPVEIGLKQEVNVVENFALTKIEPPRR